MSLNVTACLATIYGFVTIYRYGINGTHGKSLLFLTLGMLSWFLADLSLAYGHIVQHYEEEQILVVSFADPCWIIGYVFFSLHLFTALRFVQRDKIHAFSVILVIIASGSNSIQSNSSLKLLHERRRENSRRNEDWPY